MKSRYDDSEYQKQVSNQMLASPTLRTACRCIVDLRQQIKDSNGPGTPTARFDWIISELEKRFSDHKPHGSSHALERHYLTEIDKVIADSHELNAAKRQLLNIFTGDKLFPGENK